MEILEKKYIVDEHNIKRAVQIDINTFNKIEEILENYALFNLIKENENDDILNAKDAIKFYKNIKKAE